MPQTASVANATDSIVIQYLGVAESIARRYAGHTYDWSDLRQVACLGLVKAAQRFDPEKGSDFVSFAVPTISGEIKRYLRDNGWFIRPPRHLQDLRTTITYASGQLVQELGRDPSSEELAQALGEPVAAIDEASRCHEYLRLVSLDAPVSDADQLALGETLGITDPGIDRTELVWVVRKACRCLTPRERRILFLRFFEERTQQQIADELGVTQMQVSRLLVAILARLRENILTPPGSPQAGSAGRRSSGSRNRSRR
ncbi:sigma-70 family RNA polymerase sigma factor [Salinibacterium sp. ZJ454]|uniref:sigma-70 family RNA polymerase sigma factor n=1 Tax=Salinibacterium sp. ZJ454 TaxID=2708339 RepID=UPI00142051C8|nr:sigma-70 family RNA polymerase sigma factor [Salinibacterium sp. ZJ454]